MMFMKIVAKLACSFIVVMNIVCCRQNSKDNDVVSSTSYCFKYDTAEILYTTAMDYWSSLRFCSIEPDIYATELGYGGSIKSMIVSDSLFIHELSNSITQGHNKHEQVGPFDTFIMVLLNHYNTNNVDTLAISGGHQSVWINDFVYEDSCIVRTISEMILLHDKEWSEIAKDYYVEGKWIPSTKYLDD